MNSRSHVAFSRGCRLVVGLCVIVLVGVGACGDDAQESPEPLSTTQADGGSAPAAEQASAPSRQLNYKEQEDLLQELSLRARGASDSAPMRSRNGPTWSSGVDGPPWHRNGGIMMVAS